MMTLPFIPVCFSARLKAHPTSIGVTVFKTPKNRQEDDLQIEPQ
jgi:hypothetical protein